MKGFIQSEEPILTRHSQYDLNNSLPTGIEKVEELLGNILLTTPSAFNSQPVRMVLLTGAAHHRHWDLIKSLLIEKIGEEKYADGTADKIRGFRNAAGTVLFFDDEEVTRSLQERFPTSMPLGWDWWGWALAPISSTTPVSMTIGCERMQGYRRSIDSSLSWSSAG